MRSIKKLFLIFFIIFSLAALKAKAFPIRLPADIFADFIYRPFTQEGYSSVDSAYKSYSPNLAYGAGIYLLGAKFAGYKYLDGTKWSATFNLPLFLNMIDLGVVHGRQQVKIEGKKFLQSKYDAILQFNIVNMSSFDFYIQYQPIANHFFFGARIYVGSAIASLIL